jgi:hypothetical protein
VRSGRQTDLWEGDCPQYLALNSAVVSALRGGLPEEAQELEADVPGQRGNPLRLLPQRVAAQHGRVLLHSALQPQLHALVHVVHRVLDVAHQLVHVLRARHDWLLVALLALVWCMVQSHTHIHTYIRVYT